MGIEPQSNNHELNYQTTRPAREELPANRFESLITSTELIDNNIMYT